MLITSAVPAFAAETTNSGFSLETDKTEYKYGEDIVVTAAGGTDTAWVGIYKDGEKPGNTSGTVPSLFWYRSNEDWSAGKPVVVQKQITNDRVKILPPGKYDIHLFEDEGYTIIKSVEVTVSTDYVDAHLTSIEYDLDNDTDGFANGTVTVSADTSSVKGMDCIMYWADEKGAPLESYASLATFRLTGSVTEHEMYDYTIIPEGARSLIAYLSVGGSLIGDPVMTELPESCNYIIEDDYIVEFQMMSDIHVTTDTGAVGNMKLCNQHFVQMLEDVKVNSPDSIGIFTNGDSTDYGMAEEYEKMYEFYTEAANKGNGKLPYIHMAIGNHDWMRGNPDGRFQHYVKKMNPDLKDVPENVYYDEEVAGYNFIYLGSEAPGVYATLSDAQLSWFDKRMAEITAEEPDKPVFVLLHQPLDNTVAGSLPGQGWGNVNNEQALRDILKKYPQIIIMGGHSHWDLDSEMNMYPGAENMAVAVNTASLGYVWTSYNTPEGEFADGSDAYYVRVYDDKVIFIGKDFENSLYIPSGIFVIDKNDIKISQDTYDIKTGEGNVKIEAQSENGASIKFKSSDESIVSVSEDGTLTAKAAGTAEIDLLAEGDGTRVIDRAKVTVNVQEELHNFGKYTVEKKAGFDSDGYKTAKCLDEGCQAVDKKMIPKVKTPSMKKAYTFNKKAKTPTVKVKDVEGNTLAKVKSSSKKNGFVVSYAKGRKNVGKYAVRVTLKGPEYKGSMTVSFKINPAGKSISKLSRTKRSITVTWKKASSTYRKQMTGYQLRYSTSSKMNNAKIVTVKNTKATSKTIKKLKANKKYYVQLRTYKTVKNDKYYSDWSKIKRVKIK